MGCVNTKNPEFINLTKKHNVSSNKLELITHKYWLETGNETLFPTDLYIQNELGLTQYQEPGNSVRKLWELRYNTSKEYLTIEALNEAKKEASKYFPQSAIVSYLNAKGTYTLTIKQPVAKLNNSKDSFFENYDGTDTFKNLLRRAYNIKEWAYRTITDEQLKEAIIRTASEDFSNISDNLQFAIGNTPININAGTNENADLSNLAPRPFSLQVFENEAPITFNSVEQAFQYIKFRLLKKYLGFDESKNKFLLSKQPLTGEEYRENTRSYVKPGVKAAYLKANTTGLTTIGEDTYESSLQEIDTQIDKILKAKNGFEAKKLGGKNGGYTINGNSGNTFLDTIWNSGEIVSEDVMKEAIKASFIQNPQALQRLLSTGNTTLTHTQAKEPWKTSFPKLLMEVRTELAKEKGVSLSNNTTSDTTIEYTPVGKQRQTYTIKGSHIYNKEGKEVFAEDSVDRNKIFANLAVKQGRAVVINHKGTDYVVNNRQQIISTKTGKIMQWEEENGDRKTILSLAKDKFSDKQPSSLTSQLIDHLKSIGLNVLGRVEMEEFLKNNNINSLQQAIDNISEEMASIKKEAISNGTFMKAPNGNPTNLNEKQWLQVRTKAFKDWFGDWENVANFINNLNSKNNGTDKGTAGNGLATSLVGQSEGLQKGNRVFQKASSIFGGITRTDKQQQRNFTKSSFLEEIEKIAKEEDFWIEDITPMLGEKIPGGKESTVYRTPDCKDAIKLNRFSFVGNNIIGVESFIERLNTHNELFPSDNYEVIGFTKDSDGNTCIALKQPYVTGREATQKEIDDFFDGIRAEKKGHGVYTFLGYEVGDALPNNVFMDSFGNLHFLDTFSIKKARLQEVQDFYKNRDNSSKVVDENGEPLIVYHGSNYELDATKQDDWSKNALPYATYFAPHKYTGGNLNYYYSAFLNIKNPIYEHYGLTEDAIQDEDTFNKLIKEKGFDGAITGNDGISKAIDAKEIVVINPNQIKSATDNIGTFSTTDNNIEKFTTPQGEVYGFVDKDGNIYLDETVVSPEHPIHEYTHLWDRAVAKNNPELWKRGVTLMKTTSLWKEILESDNYGKQWQSMKDMTPEKLESLIASEVHSRLTGEKGREFLNKESDKKLINHLKQWLNDFFNALKETFSKWTDKDLSNLKVEDFINMTLRDLAESINPNSIKSLQDTINNMSGKELKNTLSTIEQENNDYDLINGTQTNKRELQSKTTQSFTFNDGIKVDAPFKPNSQQIDALNAMSDFVKSRETSMTLNGYAGTGKTSIMEMLAKKMKKQNKTVAFCASTNKAAKVLNDKVSKANFNAVTLNKLFGISVEVDTSKKHYNADDLIVNLKKSRIPNGSIIIIDEASMINSENYGIINQVAKRLNLKIIYVGDEAQLPPVNEDNISKVFRNNDGKVVRLTQVERTNDNAILREATAIRNGEGLSGVSSFNDKGDGVAYVSPQNTNTIDAIINKYIKGLKDNPDYFRILAYTNQTVTDYNNQVRHFLGITSPIPQKGEPMMGYTNWGYDRGTYKLTNSESYNVLHSGRNTTVTQKLADDTQISLEVTPLTLVDAYNNKVTVDYIDIVNNPQNKEAALQLAMEKSALWAKVRYMTKGSAKSNLLDRINELEELLCVNDDIYDPVNKTDDGKPIKLQNKVLDFGYAMTVHKSQGSTFTHVLIDDVDIINGVLRNKKHKQSSDAGLAKNEEDITITTDMVDMTNAEKVNFNALASATETTSTLSEVDKLQKQLEYVAVSRATDTVSIISNNIEKEDSPLKHQKKQTSTTTQTSDVSETSESAITDFITDINTMETVPAVSNLSVSTQSQDITLPRYQNIRGNNTTTADAEWKVPYLKELDAQLTTELTPEQTNTIIKKMDNILQATSETEYNQQIKASEKSITETVQEDFDTLSNQYETLIGEMARMCGLTASEVAHTAEMIVNMISDEVTAIQTKKGFAQQIFPSLKTTLDFQTATRRQIFETIGLDTLINRAKELFSPKIANYNDPMLSIQAQIIYENWDQFIQLGASTFELNEGFGIRRNHETKRFTNTEQTIPSDTDNFNNYNNDIERIAEEEGKDEQEHWQIENKTIDNLQSMTFLVRQAIHQCYEVDKEGNKVLEKWSVKKREIPKRISPRKAMNKIYRWTQGALSINDMITRLSNKQSSNPWLSQLVERLSDKTGKETDFQSQFYGVFSKHFQPYSIVLLEDGTYKSIPVNDHPAVHRVIKDMNVLLKLGQHPLFATNGHFTGNGKKLLGNNNTTSKDTSFNLHKALTELQNINQHLQHEDNPDDSFYNAAINNIMGVCHTLGFLDVSEETISNEITDETISTMTTNLASIIKVLDGVLKTQNDGKLQNYNPFDTNEANSINTALRKFLTPITDSLDDETTNAFYDSGKMYQSFVTPSFMSKLMVKFRQSGEAFEDFLNKEYGSSEWYRQGGRFPRWRTPWLRLLSTPEYKDWFDHKVELNFNKHNYMRNMSPEEYTLSMITEYFSEMVSNGESISKAWYRMPMQSNKPSSEFIRFVSYRGKDYKNDIVEGLYDMFLQELSRIQTVRMRNLKKSDPGFIKNFDTNGRKFCFLPVLNAYLENTSEAKAKQNIIREDISFNEDEKTSSKNKQLAELLQKKVNATDSLTTQEEKILMDLVREALYQSTEDRVQSILSEWENNGIIEAAIKVKGIYPSKEKYGKELTKEEKTSFAKESIENFLWNDSFASKNILQLTIGDIAFYKDAEDLQKRLAQLHAPGIRANIYATDYNGNRVSDGNYRTFILKDFDDFQSNIIANISEVFDRKIAAAPDNQKAALEALKDSLVRPRTYNPDGSVKDKGGKYWNINVADAQGYSSPSSYRKKAFMFGRWSQQAEDIYQKLQSGNYTYSDLEVAFQPLKPFVYSRMNKQIGVNNSPIQSIQVPFQAKNAEYLLIMADAILKGEELSKPNLLRAVYRVMEDSEKLNPTKGIDTVQFESAIKSSLQGAIDITPWRDVKGGEEGAYNYMMNSIYSNEADNKGNRLYKNYDTVNYVHETSFEDYCLQQEVPEHFKEHSQAHGSQIRMIIPSDLDIYTTDENGLQIENFYEFDDYDEKGNKVHKKLKADEFKKEYEETIAKSIEEDINKLCEELHLDTEDKKLRNIALSNLLIKEIESSPSRYGVDLMYACSLNKDGEFRIPKGDPIQAKRIEQLINSIIKSRINKQKIAGGPIVQVSNFGTSKKLHIRFNDKQGNLMPLEEDYDPSEHSNMPYKEYIKKHQGGIAYFEVYIPIWSNELAEKFSNPDGTIDIEAIEATDPELLKMVSYRIPTEDKYSCAPMKVVGFMPREAGDAIMLPYELTEIDDSDFDVDKRYVMRKVLHLTLDINKAYKPLVDYAVADYVKKNGHAPSKNVLTDIKTQVNTYLMNRSDRRYFTPFEEFLDAAIEEMAKTNHNIWKTITPTPKSGKLYRDNKIVDMSYSVLTNQQTADKILNPGGFDGPKRMGYMVAAYKNPNNNLSWQELQQIASRPDGIDRLKELSYTDKDLTFADTQVQFYKQNSAAASLIGIFAIGKIAHAVLEGNDIYIDISSVCGEDNFSIADFNFSGRMPLDPRADTNGNLIGKTLGSLVSASADAVKDPILNLINVNMTTADMLNAMLRLGMPFDDAALFLSQNIIEKTLDRFNRENLTGYKSLDKIINEQIEELQSKNDTKEAAVNLEPLTKEELIEGLTSEEHEKIDYKALLAFQRLSSLTSAIKKPTYATRFNSISNAVGPLIIDNLIIKYNMDKFKDVTTKDSTGFYSADGANVDINDIFYNHPILAKFAETVGIAKELFKDMPAGSTGFENLLNTLKVINPAVHERMFNDKSLLDKLSMFYQSYLAIQSGLINQDELKSTIEEFPKDFMARHEELEGKTFKELYPDNALIQAIQLGFDSKGKYYLSTIITGKDEYDKDLLRNAWIDLHYDNPELSRRLFIYSFFRGGIGFSPKTFMALIPAYVKEHLTNADGTVSYVDTFRNFPEVPYEVVLDQFMRNNWNENKLVPRKDNLIDKNTHNDVNFKKGILNILDPTDKNEVQNLKYIKTKQGNNTYLWRRISSLNDNENVSFEFIQPLGNNGEYIEMNTSDIRIALSYTTQDDSDTTETSELQSQSPIEANTSEESKPVVSDTKKANNVEIFLNTIMEHRNEKNIPTTREDAEKLHSQMKDTPKRWQGFINTIFKRMNINLKENEVLKEFEKYC